MDGETLDLSRPLKRTSGTLAFEVKLTFFVLLGLFFPITLCFLLHSKPTVQYFFGSWIGYIAVFVVMWVVVCHAAMASKVLSRRSAPVAMVILPAMLLICTSQVQKVQFGRVSAELQSVDCNSTGVPAKLDGSWQVARQFLDDCSKSLIQMTGAPVDETLSILKLQQCPGYERLEAKHSRNWQYLATVETYYKCGGWCSAGKSLWTNEARPHNSCSLAVSRALTSSVGLLASQVTVQCTVLLILASVVLLLQPGWLMQL